MKWSEISVSSYRILCFSVRSVTKVGKRFWRRNWTRSIFLFTGKRLSSRWFFVLTEESVTCYPIEIIPELYQRNPSNRSSPSCSSPHPEPLASHQVHPQQSPGRRARRSPGRSPRQPGLRLLPRWQRPTGWRPQHRYISQPLLFLSLFTLGWPSQGCCFLRITCSLSGKEIVRLGQKFLSLV